MGESGFRIGSYVYGYWRGAGRWEYIVYHDGFSGGGLVDWAELGLVIDLLMF